ncbi:MAG: N-acetylglucosamine-6-phosphate deacetylase [Eubacterium sp.]|nr:N-acetylglucosamine-6-phosphate deacetylase [Eubacterium sp.]
MLLKNCTFFNESFEKEFGDIKTENGIITEIGFINGDGIDMGGKILLPGFIDVHIHGANGGDTGDNSAESLNKMSAYLSKNGVTSFCPTTMSRPVDELIKTAGVIADYKYTKNSSGAKVAGINFEGPFISREKCGSQNKEYIVEGTPGAFEKLYGASGGLMKLITIAPEAFDSREFIENCASRCTVSIGHTNATANECKTALSLGAKHFTHLFNAMSPMTSREAGTVGAALDSTATCELICDGYHICPETLRNAFKILGENRAVAVSDSMRAAGLGAGEYELGGQTVYVKENDGVARLPDGTIAASVTNLFDEFKNLLNFGIDFKTALKACTINPARVIGCEGSIGSIAVGKSADFTVVDEELNLVEVYINGTLA